MVKWKAKTLKKQLILLDTVIVLTLTLILICVLFMDKWVMDKNAKNYLYEQVELIQNQLNEYYEQIDAIAKAVAYDPDIQGRLTAEDPVQKFDLHDDVRQTIASMSQLSNDIITVHIFDSNMYLLNSADYYVPNEIVEILFNNMDGSSKFSDYLKFPLLGSSGDVSRIYVTNKISCIEDGKYFGDDIGYVCVALNVSKIRHSLGIDLSRNTDVYILDSNNRIVSTKDITNSGKTFQYSQITNAKNNIVRKANLEDVDTYFIKSANESTGFTIVLMAESRDIINGFQGYKRLYILVFSILMLIIIIITLLVIRQMVVPLHKATTHISSIKGYENAQLDIGGSKEVNILFNEFNKMLVRMELLNQEIVDMNTRLLKSQLIEKQSEINMLMMQINPHFLYNTLETIKGMAMIGAKEAVKQATSAMANIFRYTIRGKNFVKLEEEVKILKEYMNIHILRYNNRFDVIYDIDEDVMDCIIPKMILQPICENNIHHGIELLDYRGEIHINIFKQENELIIIIKDNGNGIEPERLYEIKERLANFDTDMIMNDNSRIGIFNVHSRIVLHYGGDYGLFIDSEYKKETTVTINLPYIVEEQGV